MKSRLRPIDVSALRCFLCKAPAYEAVQLEDPDIVDEIIAQSQFFGDRATMMHVCPACSTSLFGAIERGKKVLLPVRLPNKPPKKGGSKTKGGAK